MRIARRLITDQGQIVTRFQCDSLYDRGEIKIAIGNMESNYAIGLEMARILGCRLDKSS